MAKKKELTQKQKDAKDKAFWVITTTYPVIKTKFHVEKMYEDGQYYGKEVFPGLTEDDTQGINRLRQEGCEAIVLRDYEKDMECVYKILTNEPNKGDVSIFPKYGRNSGRNDGYGAMTLGSIKKKVA